MAPVSTGLDRRRNCCTVAAHACSCRQNEGRLGLVNHLDLKNQQNRDGIEDAEIPGLSQHIHSRIGTTSNRTGPLCHDSKGIGVNSYRNDA